MESKNNILYRECWHKLRAPIAKANTSRKSGRLFWGCQLWKTNNCHYFKWLPNDAAEAYMQLRGGLEGVEVIDTANSLELLQEQCDRITTLVDENKMLKMRQEVMVGPPTVENENRRLRMKLEAIVKEGQKTALFYLVFGLVLRSY